MTPAIMVLTPLMLPPVSVISPPDPVVAITLAVTLPVVLKP